MINMKIYDDDKLRDGIDPGTPTVNSITAK
jgi:hypothetical protein